MQDTSILFIFLFFIFPAKERTLKDSDLEKFKQQASCLGFSGEPNFDFDSKTGASFKTCLSKEQKHNVSYQTELISFSVFVPADLCKEGEGLNMALNWRKQHLSWQIFQTESKERKCDTKHQACGICICIFDLLSLNLEYWLTCRPFSYKWFYCWYRT